MSTQQIKQALLACTIFMAGGLAGCREQAIVTPPPPAQSPVVASLSPTSANAGAPALTLTVNGSNFLSGATIMWNGTALTTTVVSGSQVTAPVPVNLLAQAGVINVTIQIPVQGGTALTSNAATFTVNNVSPQVTGLNPVSAIAGGAAFTLTVNGSGFVNGATVQWNGSNRTTTFVSASQVTAAITAADVAAAGNAQVTVANPSPGGGPSAATSFSITNPVPAISGLAPNAAVLSGAAFTLTVNGSGFVNGATVQWNASNRPTTFVSASQVTAAIPAADIAAAGVMQVTVVNPAPGGGTSPSAAFSVTNPVPVISGLTPSIAVAGDPAFTLTVDGSGFIAASLVQWNGASRTTTFVSSTRLTAAIPAGDVAVAGNPQITVVNPAPGGGTSPATTFAIVNPNPVPTVSGISPSSAIAGAAAFTLTVDGTGFVNGSSVLWNGSSRVTSFISNLQLTAAIPATDVASAGSAVITVSSPAPGGGTSASSATFTIQTPAPPAAVIVRASLGPADVQGNGFGDSLPDVSASGRWVAFVSGSSNWVAGDSPNTPDVFVRDTCLGAPAGCVPSTALVSASPAGQVGNRASNRPAISGNGRYVAFISEAFNLTADPVFRGEIYLRDTCAGAPAGCVPATQWVSMNSAGAAYTGELSVAIPTHTPSISRNGRWVAFVSSGDLVLPDSNGTFPDVYVRDTCVGAAAGCTPSTMRASLDNNGAQVPSGSPHGAISPDGRFVAFLAAGLAAPQASVLGYGVYLRDTCNGASPGCVTATIPISLSSAGVPADNGGFEIYQPTHRRLAVSDGGRFVAFESLAANLVPPVNQPAGQRDLYVRDTCMGAPAGCSPTTIRASLGATGNQYATGSGSFDHISISGDGRLVSYVAGASNLVPQPDTNNASDVFVRDTCLGAPAGCVPTTVRTSNLPNGSPGNNSSDTAILSSSGGYIVFASRSPDFLAGDTNGAIDIYLAATSFPANPLFASSQRLKETFLAAVRCERAPSNTARAKSGEGHRVGGAL
jgi:hypothetical protein